MAHYITDKDGNLIEVAGNFKESDINTTIANFQKQIDNTITNINTNMLGVPSNDNIIDISVTSNNVHYVAPSNGYLKVKGNNTTTSDSSAIRIYNMGNMTSADSANAKLLSTSAIRYGVTGFGHGCFVPCKKGDNIYIGYLNTNNLSAKFIPAEEV